MAIILPKILFHWLNIHILILKMVKNHKSGQHFLKYYYLAVACGRPGMNLIFISV